MSDHADTIRRRIIQALEDTEGCKTVAIVMARTDLEALLKLMPSDAASTLSSVTLDSCRENRRLRSDHT